MFICRGLESHLRNPTKQTQQFEFPSTVSESTTPLFQSQAIPVFHPSMALVQGKWIKVSSLLPFQVSSSVLDHHFAIFFLWKVTQIVMKSWFLLFQQMVIQLVWCMFSWVLQMLFILFIYSGDKKKFGLLGWRLGLFCILRLSWFCPSSLKSMKTLNNLLCVHQF